MNTILNWLAFILVVAFLCITVVLRTWLNYKRTGKSPITFARRDDAHGLIGTMFACCLVSIMVLAGLTALWPAMAEHLGIINVLHQVTVRCGGLGLGVLALIPIVIAQAQMGDAWRIGIDLQNKTTLVCNGIFKYSRNPIFAGMRLALFGLLLALPIAPMLAVWLLGDSLMQVQVRLEEQHLDQIHGASYRKYMQTAPRWI